MAVIQPHPTHILYQCAKFGDDRTSFNVIFDVCDVWHVKGLYPYFWYFISQLLVEISIWNSYRTLIGSLSIHQKIIDFDRSKVKVTGTVHCFLKVQSYHKNWAIEIFKYFFVDTSLYALSIETIKTRASREMTSQKIRQYLTFNM